MLKELTTMALVATITTNVTSHFDVVMLGAQDIASIYNKAATSKNPDEFISSVEHEKKRLDVLSKKVAAMNIQKELGPFGVVIPQ